MASFMTKVSFAPKVAILMKATSDDVNPTPGYLFDEISKDLSLSPQLQPESLMLAFQIDEKITYESLEYCDYMTDFLTERLNKKSLHVKGKVLLVMKSVLAKGHDEFAKCLRRKDLRIQECKVINGPTDPLHGDTFYVNIRTHASNVLEILFDLDKKKEYPPMPITNQTSFSSGKKMEGYGNTSNHTQNAGLIKEAYGNLKDAFQNFVSQSSPLSSGPSASHTDNKYTIFETDSRSTIQRPSDTLSNFFDSPAVTTTSTMQSSYSTQLLSQQSGAKHNWVVKTSDNKSNERLETHSQKVSQKAIDADMFETEKKLVEEIAAIQGIRPQPAKRDVDTLIKRCHNLDCSVVVTQLRGKLSESDTRVQLRVMWVLEGMLESNLPYIQTLIENSCIEKLKELKTSSHTPVRNKASKVLSRLGSDIMENFSNQPGGSQPNSSALDDDLFGSMQIRQDTQPKLIQASSASTDTSLDILSFDSFSQPSQQRKQGENKSSSSTSTPFYFDPFAELSSNNTSSVLSSSQQSAVNMQQHATNSSSFILPSPVATRQNIPVVKPPPPAQPAINKPTPQPNNVSLLPESDFFANFERSNVIDSSSSKQSNNSLIDQNNLDPFATLNTPSMLSNNVNNQSKPASLISSSSLLQPNSSFGQQSTQSSMPSNNISIQHAAPSLNSSSNASFGQQSTQFLIPSTNSSSQNIAASQSSLSFHPPKAQSTINNAQSFHSFQGFDFNSLSLQPQQNTGNSNTLFGASQSDNNLRNIMSQQPLQNHINTNTNNTSMLQSNFNAMSSPKSTSSMFSANHQPHRPAMNMNMMSQQRMGISNYQQRPSTSGMMPTTSNIYNQNSQMGLSQQQYQQQLHMMNQQLRQQQYHQQQNQQQQMSSNMSFLRGGSSTHNKGSNDSFDFVKDAMKASKK